MRSGRSRAFTIGDALLLLIVVGFTATAVVHFDREIRPVFAPPEEPSVANQPRPWHRWTRGWLYPASRVHADVEAGLAVLGPGLAILAFRRWNALSRRDWQSPGLLTLASILVLAAFHLALNVIDYGQRGLVPAVNLSYSTWFPWALSATGIVFGTWTMLAISGKWRRPSGWRDRAGRWLGLAWLASYGFEVISPIIWG